MSKIKLLLDVVTDLRSLADSLQAVADAMTSNEPVDKSRTETTAQVSTQSLRKRQLHRSKCVKCWLRSHMTVLQLRFEAFLKSMVRQNSARSIQASMPPFLQKRRH